MNRTQFQFACWNDKQKVFKNYRPSKPCIGVLVTVTKRLKASQTLLVWMPTAKTGCRRAKVWLAAFLDQPFFALRPIFSPSPPVTVQTAWRSTSRGLSNQILDRVVKIGLVFSDTRKCMRREKLRVTEPCSRIAIPDMQMCLVADLKTWDGHDRWLED